MHTSKPWYNYNLSHTSTHITTDGISPHNTLATTYSEATANNEFRNYTEIYSCYLQLDHCYHSQGRACFPLWAWYFFSCVRRGGRRLVTFCVGKDSCSSQAMNEGSKSVTGFSYSSEPVCSYHRKTVTSKQ